MSIKGAIEQLSREGIVIVALVGIAVYLSWLHILFKWFRPGLAKWLSRLLNITIADSLVSGSWEIIKGGRWWKSLLVFFLEAVVFIGGAFGPLLMAGLILVNHINNVSPPQPTGVTNVTPASTKDLTEGIVDILLGEEFVLERGQMAVLANNDFTILNEGEGSEYYTDDAGNEVHDATIKLVINDKIVFLTSSISDVTIDNYVIGWRPVNRLRVTKSSEKIE